MTERTVGTDSNTDTDFATDIVTDTRSASLWRHANFLRLWGGEAGAQIGSALGGIAIPVLAVAILGAGELEVGLLGAAGTAAFLLVGLPAGAWIDRALKRRIMMRANLVRALALASIPVLWLSGILAMWQLLIVAAIVGIATVFFDIAYQSYIPVLVPRDRIADANGKLESTAQLAGVGGPAAGGAILAVVSAPLVLAATAFTYLLSFAALASIRDDERPRSTQDRRPLRTEIAEGMSFVWNNRLLRSIAACTSVTNLFSTLAMTMIPLLVLRDLAISPAMFGIALSVGAAGGLLGAMLAAPLARLLGEGTVIPLSAVLGGLALVPIALMPNLPDLAFPLLIGGMFVTSVSVLVYNIAQVSFRQRICPVPLLGRMNASIRFVVWGVLPIAAVLSGALSAAWGISTTLWIGVVGTLLASVFVVFSPLLTMRTLPNESVAAQGEPEHDSASPAS